MRLAEAQTDAIIEAGQQLESQGSPVNGWTLRRALGDKGRPDQLIEVWQAHRGVVPAASVDASPGVLPPELVEQADRGRSELTAHYNGLILAMFSRVDALLRERCKAEFDRLVAERGEMQEQLDAAGASVTATESALGKALASTERMREALMLAQTEIVRAEKRIQAAEEQRDCDRQAAAQQAADLQTQIAALSAVAEAEARHCREQATHLAASAEAARGEAAALAAEVATARAGTAAERRRADKAEQDGAAAQKAAAAASLASAALSGEAQQLRGKVAQLTSALDAANSSALAQEQRAQKAEQDLAHALDERRKHEEATGIIYIT